MSDRDGRGILDQDDARRLADLAGLELDERALADAAGALNRLLAHVDRVLAVDVSGVPETASGEPLTELRPDRLTTDTPRDELLRSADRTEQGWFAVPNVLFPGPEEEP